MQARDIVRSTDEAYEPSDPLGMDATIGLARQIYDAVGDPLMRKEIAMKVARAVVDRQVSASELAELLDKIVARRSSIRSPGAYFLTSVRKIFNAQGLEW